MKRLFIILLVFNSLLFSQWEEAKIYPFSGEITAFHLTDSLNITAVYHGDSSAVIRSSDGGRTWSLVAKTPVTYAKEASFIDKDTFFIGTGSPAPIYKTFDGGLTWIEAPLPPWCSSVGHMQFFDAKFGYALLYPKVGAYDMMVKTSDGGLNWVVIDSTYYAVNRFEFINQQEGWLFGEQLRHTTNGGNSFTQVSLPPGLDNAWSMDIISDSIIVVGGSKQVPIPPYFFDYAPHMAFSTDRGVSWNVQDFSGSYLRGVPSDLCFLDENTAISILTYGSGVIYTTDKGVNWSGGHPPARSYKYNDMKVLENKVYVSGSGSVFVASGQNIVEPWDLRLENIVLDHRGFDAMNPGSIVIGTYNPGSTKSKLYVSTDKGRNWKTEYFPDVAGMVVEIASDSLVLISSVDQIYKSDISCKVFQPLGPTFSSSIQEIKVALNGNIVVGTLRELRLSTDNGQTWSTKLSNTTNPYKCINMFADGTGFVLSNDLFRTTDFGTSWTPVGVSGITLKHSSFYDGKNGFIVGSNQKIYRTRNAGITFEEVTFPGLTQASYIYCFDSLSYYLPGNKLFSTYDGGLSWKENDTKGLIGNSFYNIYMFDHLDGVAMNFYGLPGIWVTYNRGNTPVELSLFSALPFGNKVVLQWTTETETNNMGFEIERKYRNGDWKKIAFSKGSGTSTRKIFYGYDDYEPKAPAILYYRLKQIDYNGEFEYSNEVEVLLGEVPENYSIQQNYPNPFNPSTKVTFSLPEENKVVIRVFNAMGEQVREIERGILSHGYFEQDFEMGTESSGMYFCQVLCTNTISGRTKSLTIKMVLMK